MNAKLIEHGLEDARKRHTRLGVPLYDVEKIITWPQPGERQHPAQSRSHQHDPGRDDQQAVRAARGSSPRTWPTPTPGATSTCTTWASSTGPTAPGQSLEYVKKFGLNLPNALSIAKPAKHPETLLAHMVKFSAALQGHFAGAIGWDAVNIFFAPFLVGLSEREMKQLAQMLIFEYSQQSVARGGQAIFSDLNIYWEVPTHFENVEAIGPGRAADRQDLQRLSSPRRSGSPGRCSTSTWKATAPGGRSSSPSRWSTSPTSSSGPRATRTSCSTSATWPRRRATPTSCSTAARPPRSPSAAGCPSSWSSRTWTTPRRPGGCGTAPCRTSPSTCRAPAWWPGGDEAKLFATLDEFLRHRGQGAHAEAELHRRRC